ncbi:hypothetical protein [Streptomyces sp. NPDC058308]|uniref:hypothetical protein n=1 Tax=Streptomyces sp. NPDC058308 TaxID=3346440 RepID=UPI0036EC0E24
MLDFDVIGDPSGMEHPHAPLASPWLLLELVNTVPREHRVSWGPLYVFGLSVLTEALALLCTGLVSRWGEKVPDWVPLIGGRRVAPPAAIVPAALGGLGLVALWDTMPLGWFGLLGFHEVAFTNGWWLLLARVCISPVMLWGPIVLALTYAYYRRSLPGPGRKDHRGEPPALARLGIDAPVVDPRGPAGTRAGDAP